MLTSLATPDGGWKGGPREKVQNAQGWILGPQPSQGTGSLYTRKKNTILMHLAHFEKERKGQVGLGGGPLWL